MKTRVQRVGLAVCVHITSLLSAAQGLVLRPRLAAPLSWSVRDRKLSMPKLKSLSPVKASTLRQNVAEVLIHAILSGKFRPGDRLNESELGFG
jgi:hypothetical protein